MTVPVWLFRAMTAFVLLVGMSGCVPQGQSELDEEKEPHFLAGKKAINVLDYRGAIEEFHRALEVNPHNSKAHSQLGWLYETKENDAAAAIYHYERYLKLRPGSDNAEVIRQRIMNCKQDLAKSVWPLPIAPGMQKQLEQLLDENRRLKEENERFRLFLASRPATNIVAPQPLPTRRESPQVTPLPPQPAAVTNRQAPLISRPIPGSRRTHTVQSGDTMASISRRYGVRLGALAAANPGIDPRRMRPGQIIVLP
ncbi:MAG TPA: LysM peptidoglycan-binding domain-containing protein [Verrucomicrobiae bacterium]|nr:LysM peptidoglycan-binding domain-containing protein [Verrucomicrobiae bacterium]